MREYFAIDGYWKDDKETFQGLIVTSYDEIPDETEPYTDDDIFFYGLEEHVIQEAITLEEDTMHDFVITGYTKIIL